MKHTLSRLALGILVVALGIGVFYGVKLRHSRPHAPVAHSDTPFHVEVFYLPHAPARAIVTKVRDLVQKDPRYTITTYDFEDPANAALIAAHHLTNHTPVAIFIGGRDTFTIDGRTVQLRNFPQSNTFVPGFGGAWDYADLAQILAHPNRYRK